MPPVVLGDLPRGRSQVEGAPVVTETAPGLEHRPERRPRQGIYIGEPVQKGPVLLEDARHLGLLEHHLGDEYAVWICRPAPGQVVSSVFPVMGVHESPELGYALLFGPTSHLVLAAW